MPVPFNLELQTAQQPGWLSQHTDYATGSTAKELGFDFRQGQEIFFSQ
jgi:hypothetical protein